MRQLDEAAHLDVTIALMVHLLDGWYWFAICGLLFWQQLRVSRNYSAMLSTVGVSLVWPALFAVTGDRRFFFPFTMFSAAMFGQLWSGGFVAGSLLIVGVFTAIRVIQLATTQVLAVELAVAAVAIAAAMYCRRFGPLVAAAAASLIAMAGLIF